jgi:hypothetical protein
LYPYEICSTLGNLMPSLLAVWKSKSAAITRTIPPCLVHLFAGERSTGKSVFCTPRDWAAHFLLLLSLSLRALRVWPASGEPTGFRLGIWRSAGGLCSGWRGMSEQCRRAAGHWVGSNTPSPSSPKLDISFDFNLKPNQREPLGVRWDIGAPILCRQPQCYIPAFHTINWSVHPGAKSVWHSRHLGCGGSSSASDEELVDEELQDAT